MNVTKRHYSLGSDVTAKAAKAIPAGSFVWSLGKWTAGIRLSMLLA